MPNTGKTLYVLVRGWGNGKRDSGAFTRLAGSEFPTAFAALVGGLPNSELMVADLAMGLWSTTDPDAISTDLLNQISAAFHPDTHARIVLVCYSAGGAIGRAALTRAFGIDADGRLHKDRTLPWASQVVRVVYLSSLLRGWDYSTAMPALVNFLGPLILRLLRLRGNFWGARLMGMIGILPGSGPPFIEHLRRGEPFVIGARLAQVGLRDAVVHGDIAAKGLYGSAPEGAVLPYEQVSLLGTQDEILSPVDCIEQGYGPSNVFAEIPRTSHKQMLNLDPDRASSQRNKDIITHRREMVLKALTAPFDEMKGNPAFDIHPDDLNDHFDEMDLPLAPDATAGTQADQVVIVLHGIRDNGFWTKRIGWMLKQGETRPLIRTPSPSYGFFSLLDFIRPGKRHAQSKWFLEFYANAREYFPRSKAAYEAGTVNISFVGHSNGTYLAKRALELVPAVRFHRIIFAGSVVRRDFDWQARRAQVDDRVLNIAGIRDGVVAFLPSSFERLGLKFLDVGGAGFFGFDGESAGGMVETRHVAGSHRSVIGEDHWARMRGFLIDGQMPASEGLNKSTFMAWLAPVLLLLGFGVLLLVLYGLHLGLSCLLMSWGLQGPLWPRALSGGLILFVLWRVLRFF